MILEEYHRQRFLPQYSFLTTQKSRGTKKWTVSTAPTGEVRLTEYNGEEQTVLLFPRRLEGVSFEVDCGATS